MCDAKRKGVIIGMEICMLFLLLRIAPYSVMASQKLEIESFIGRYFCETKELGEYENPETFSLGFNGEGKLERYSGMAYGTTGTSIYYEYTSYRITKNVLICEYDGAYGYYGTMEEIEPGSHQYILNEDGSITAEGHVWYRNIPEEVQEKSKTLPAVKELDFPCGAYTSDATFLGVEELSRKEIESITFFDTLKDVPEMTWDVSGAKDGSVRMWRDNSDGRCRVFIAAEGVVIANEDSRDLFRLCTNLTEIDFNSAFDTSGTVYFSDLFRDCKLLSNIKDMDSLDTSRAYDFHSTFQNCESIHTLDLRDFVTNGVHDMQKMFYGCRNLETLRIDNFSFAEDSLTEDIFVETKWEGSSPLLDYGDSTISTACILDTAISVSSSRLRAHIINGYDDVLKELVADKAGLFGEWKDTNCYIFYDIKDVNADEIPELIVRKNTEGVYTFTIYYFDIVSCTVRRMNGETIFSNWPELYLYPEKGIVRYSTESGYKMLEVDGVRLRELEDCDISNLTSEGLNYTLASPENIELFYTHLLGGESKNLVLVKASLNARGGYNYLKIYVDDKSVFKKELSGVYSDIEVNAFYTREEWDDTGEEIEDVGKRSDFIYLRVGEENGHGCEYSAVLEYRENSFSEKLLLSDLVDLSQINSESDSNYFSISVDNENDMIFTFHLDTYGLGDNLEFSIRYLNTIDQGFLQKTFVADIDNTWSPSQNVTVNSRLDVFEKVGSRSKAFELEEGEHVRYDKIWFSGGVIWIRLENEGGKKGWIPMGTETLFKEVGKNNTDFSLWNEIKEAVSGGKYSDLELPSSSTLYQLGEKYYGENDFDTAEIYLKLIEEESSYFDNAQTILDVISERMNGTYLEVDNISETDLTESEEELDETLLYTSYIKKIIKETDEDISYAVLDINENGKNELLLRYASNSECEVYTYDEQSGAVLYAAYIPFINAGMFYSQKYQMLVYLYRTSDSRTYQFYQFDGKNLNECFSVGWHDAKGETYTRHFFYSDQKETRNLGYYVYVGEEKNVGKAKLEQQYHEYLQYMMEINFSDAAEILNGDKGGYVKTLSTDNIPSDDMESMLDVIRTYLNSGRWGEWDDNGASVFDTSYKKEDFWFMMQTYSRFASNSLKQYTMEEIQRIGYAMFSDFNGAIPEDSGEFGVEMEDGTVTFMPIQTEDREVLLTDFLVLEDGSIDAVYCDTGFDNSAGEIYVHFERNEEVDYSSYTPLYYRIVSMERRVSGAGKESTDIFLEQSDAEEYIFADSSSRYLAAEELQGLSAEELKYARNEIYARHGRLFNDQKLQSYFNAKSWYQGTIAPEDFQENMISEIERANIELILEYESS